MEQETLLQDSAIRVMLVDDHKTMLWGLEKLLAGAQPAMRVVGCAGDIETALAMAAALRPACSISTSVASVRSISCRRCWPAAPRAP